MTRQLHSKFIPGNINAGNISQFADTAERHSVDNLLWSAVSYKPQVNFSMCHTTDSILLKYFVKEKYALAKHTAVNDLVYKDSCVEFFIAFNNSKYYYNLEFNCIGTPYGGYGSDNTDRVELPANVVEQIRILTSVNEVDTDGLTAWDIALQIPVSVFINDNITAMPGQMCKANFYKCGDELPEPHFLSWNNILSKDPNFHVPEFFGDVIFA